MISRSSDQPPFSPLALLLISFSFALFEPNHAPPPETLPEVLLAGSDHFAYLSSPLADCWSGLDPVPCPGGATLGVYRHSQSELRRRRRRRTETPEAAAAASSVAAELAYFLLA